MCLRKTEKGKKRLPVQFVGVRLFASDELRMEQTIGFHVIRRFYKT